MRFMLQVRLPIVKGNAMIKEGNFGQTMGQLLAEIKAESAYISLLDGKRCVIIFVNVDDASQLPSVFAPLFFWLECEIDCTPVMTAEDLQRGGPGLEAAIKKWG